MAALISERLELPERLEVLVIENASRHRTAAGETGSLRWRLALAVLAGEEAAGERREGDDPDAASLAGGDQLPLDIPLQQVVLVLSADHRRQVFPSGDAGGGGDLPAAVVAVSYVPHLP